MAGKSRPVFPAIGKIFRPFSNEWKNVSARFPAIGKRSEKLKVFDVGARAARPHPPFIPPSWIHDGRSKWYATTFPFESK
jgi:hypothetical protein